MQKKKKLLHFFGGRHVAGDRGIFERFGVLSLWKEIGYVLRLFPFCSGLEAELVPARDAGSEAGGWGTLSRGAGGGETKSLCGAWGGPVGRCVN